MPVYLVLDTESSVRMDTRLRVLVALAYEVLATDDDARAVHPPHSSSQSCCVRARGYDIVRQPSDSPLDPDSHRIHQIDVPTSQRTGRPLRTILANLAEVIREYRPTAIVGHDVHGDIALLISECVRSDLNPNIHFGDWLRQLICTKIGGAVPCGIPLLSRRGGGGDVTGRLKWPNLDECYQRLCHSKVDWGTGGHLDPTEEERWPAHDARGDVERCRAVFLSLIRGRLSDPQSTE